MPDDIDTALAALQDAAPQTEDEDDSILIGGDDVVIEPDQPLAEKPPTKTEAEIAAEAAAKEAEKAKLAPLPPEEIAKRYDQTKAALREERQQRRQLAAETKAAREQAERLEAAFQKVQEQLRAPAPAEQPYQDPVEFLINERNEDIRYQQQQYAEQQRQRQAAEAAQRQMAELNEIMVDHANDFRDDHPDYDDAVNHLLGHWDGVFEQFGYAPEARGQLIQNLIANVISTSLQAKRNPAQAAYEAAKRAGYTGAAPPPAPPANGNGNGAANGADQLARLKAGQEAAKTLSGGGSGVQGEGMTLKQIASLDGAAFDSAMEKLRRMTR